MLYSVTCNHCKKEYTISCKSKNCWGHQFIRSNGCCNLYHIPKVGCSDNTTKGREMGYDDEFICHSYPNYHITPSIMENVYIKQLCRNSIDYSKLVCEKFD